MRKIYHPVPVPKDLHACNYMMQHPLLYVYKEWYLSFPGEASFSFRLALRKKPADDTKLCFLCCASRDCTLLSRDNIGFFRWGWVTSANGLTESLI